MTYWFNGETFERLQRHALVGDMALVQFVDRSPVRVWSSSKRIPAWAWVAAADVEAMAEVA